jgi:DNA-binding CsgD family transcriptional regulator
MIWWRVDVVFFVLSLGALGLGSAAVVLLLHPGGGGDRGTRSLVIPLSLLTVVTVLELASAYVGSRYPEQTFQLFTVAYEWTRIAIALGWLYIGYHHYALNAVHAMRWDHLRVAGVMAGLLVVATVVGVFRVPSLMVFVHVTVIAMLYFAGIKGVLILRRTDELLPSSRVAVAVAALSLAVYPAIAIGDVLGWRLPLLDPRLSLWVQAHPLYVFVVLVPISIYLVHHHLQPSIAVPRSISIDAAQAVLTGREADVLRLLYDGKRYREIADELFVSMPTVKTHVQHIYRKLGVTRREELFLLVRNEG